MNKETLYVPTDIDMLELAMEINNQFSETDEVTVIYENSDEDMGISNGDILGVFTITGLKMEGYLS